MRQKIIIISSDMIISNDNFYIIFAIKTFKISLNGEKKKKPWIFLIIIYLYSLYLCGMRMCKFRKKIEENHEMDNWDTSKIHIFSNRKFLSPFFRNIVIDL